MAKSSEGDIFDRLMSWRLLKPLEPFYKKYKEQLLYLFFGGLTTLLNIVLFWMLTRPIGLNALIANVIGWIICVLFAYVTNRTWVFNNKAHNAAEVIRECASFYIGRLSTLLLEEFVLWIGIDLLQINSMSVKIFAQILVIISNYVISKVFVFKDDTSH